MCRTSIRTALLLLAACVLAACGTAQMRNSSAQSLLPAGSGEFQRNVDRAPAIPPPALIAVNLNSAQLEYWPIALGGGQHPHILSKIPGVFPNAMAAHGNSLVIANQTPPEVVFYNVDTKTKSAIADPYGTPLDVAIDKNQNVYVPNDSSTPNVTIFPANLSKPVELLCSRIKLAEGVALDDEGDIFVAGDGDKNAPGIFEIPNGPAGPEPQNCFRLSLKSLSSGVSGLTVDPKTDDLLVMDNPSICAGGEEGRLTIYPKPYQKSTGHSVVLGGNCPGGIRLNATSTIILYSDSDVSSSFSFIRQSSYPEGRRIGIYSNGDPGAFATIPNTLPN